MGLFNNRKQRDNKEYVPVWFMRQAGRYHSHYQNIKKSSDFMTMCKTPELACEITLGPIFDFNFDAAILFSDLLFPLDFLGMGLSYQNGPPTLEYKLDHETKEKLRPIDEAANYFSFQRQALSLLKQKLPAQTSLLGFTGAPFTLYTYAVEGSHSGNLITAKKGLYNGLYSQFLKIIKPVIIQNLCEQAKASPDGLCLFDTAAGELCLHDFKQFIVPHLKEITQELKSKYPEVKIIYYSKHTQLDYLKAINEKSIDVLGIDWRNNLSKTLRELSSDYYIQGNFDPIWLHLNWSDCHRNLEQLYETLVKDGVDLSKWICGLGHGVTIQTPEMNVRNAVELIQSEFNYSLKNN